VRSRLTVLTLALLATTSLHGAAEEDSLPLPRWTAEDGISALPTEGNSPLENALLPNDMNFIREMEGMDSAGNSLSSTAPAAPKSAFDGFFFFIPKGNKAKPKPAPSPPPLLAAPRRLIEVGPDFLAKCETTDSDDHLFDPNPVLPETQGETLRRLLSYHAEESAMTANMLLLDENQKLPAGMDLARIAGGRLLEGNQCLVVYALGQPLRSRLFMSHKVTAVVPASYLQALLRACVADSLQATEPEEQLQRFATQLSIRLIWMERAYPAAFKAPSRAEPPPVLQAAQQDPMPEVAAPPSPAAPPVLDQARDLWTRSWPTAAWSLGGLAVLGILTSLGLRSLRRKRSQTVWILPELPAKHQPRLGGPHCGGGGAWVKYG
jgi:hypothetical protein